MRRLLLPALACFLVAACGSTTSDPSNGSSTSGSGGHGGVAGSGGEAPDGGVEELPPPEPTICDTMGLPKRDFAAGPYGTHRHDLADDFTMPLLDGSSWSFKERWTGCESYVFVPDTLDVSATDSTSVWEKDIDDLIATSPRNAHYFFVSRQKADDSAAAAVDAMGPRIEAELATLAPEDAAHWRSHLHVVKTRAGLLGHYVGDLIDKGIGRDGLAIDRQQRLRGVGSLADVKRYSSALANAGQWPWKANLAYAANEVRYFEFEEARQQRLDAEHAKIVRLWNNEVLSEFAEVDLTLPDAAEMATYDTLEIDVTANCPNPDLKELGNCGAWDYLAHLFVRDELGADVELGRFITTYHREGRYIVDATPMLALLKNGGKRHFRWVFAPPWNVQPTATSLSLRFSNQNKGYKPAEATFLWGGGAFNSAYNDARLPASVPIPADAKRVELWAIVTGHGAATSSCAEFCNHQHEFTVNGAVFLDEFPGVSDELGCANEIEKGTVPNQAGTWWFGRGGWCPGRQVDPWVVDVTAEAPAGTTATVSYAGLFKDKTPLDDSGDIVLSSYLVVYR